MNLLPWPREWVGTDALAAWMKRLLNRCKQETLLESKDFRRVQTNNGYFIEAKARASGGKSTPAVAQIVPYAITVLNHPEFYIAAKLTNLAYAPTLLTTVASIDSGMPVKIAKPPPIRRTVKKESIDGVIITYRDAPAGNTLNGFSDNNRIANDGTSDEVQCLYPRYMAVGDTGSGLTTSNLIPTSSLCIIYAMEVEGGAGVFDASVSPPEAIKWVEVLPARVWSKRFVT